MLRNKNCSSLTVLAIGILSIYFIILNVPVVAGYIADMLVHEVRSCVAPGLTYYDNLEHLRKTTGMEVIRNVLLPVGSYIGDNIEAVVAFEPEILETSAKTVVKEEILPKEKLPKEKTQSEGSGQTVYFKAKEPETVAETKQESVQVVTPRVITGNMYKKAQLSDISFLMSKFYTVTSATELNAQILRPADFLSKDMAIKGSRDLPQILIFHTHSQETFVDSVPGNRETSIVGVGDYLTELLQNKGYNVIHDTTVYDLVNGKLDRSAAYTYAQENVERILEKNPSIEVVIDLHRDGVDEKTRLVTQVNGKPTAKIMFFNGLSYSKLNGDITYLPNPNRDENLSMSLQMQLIGNAYYPGFLRRIYINSYRYVLHLRGKSTLIEAGAQNNTVAEVKNAMEPLADILDRLLKGEKCYIN